MSDTETATLHGVECSDVDATARHAWLAKHAGRFLDSISGEILDEENGQGGWGEEDREGHPLIGYDEMGCWWGTERAAWVLSDVYYTVEVWGYMGPDFYIGYFIGTVEEAYDYCVCHGVRVTLIQSGANGKLYYDTGEY